MRLGKIIKIENSTYKFLYQVHKKRDTNFKDSIRFGNTFESFIKNFSQFYNCLNFLFLKTKHNSLKSLLINSNKLIVKWNILKFQNCVKKNFVLLVLNRQNFIKDLKNSKFSTSEKLGYTILKKKISRITSRAVLDQSKIKYLKIREIRLFFFLSISSSKIIKIFKYKNSNRSVFIG